MKFEKLLFIVSLYIIIITFFKGYNYYYPTIPIYPDNSIEIKCVKKQFKNKDTSDINFFYLTNKSVSHAFAPYVSETHEELDRIAMMHNNIILFLKYSINRARPEQIDKTIKPINKDTAKTPSYPAGHSYQAYLLYKYLSKKYPQKKDLLKNIALKCDSCRVKAGLHYPSDGIFSRKIVDFLIPDNNNL